MRRCHGRPEAPVLGVKGRERLDDDVPLCVWEELPPRAVDDDQRELAAGRDDAEHGYRVVVGDRGLLWRRRHAAGDTDQAQPIGEGHRQLRLQHRAEL